MAQEAMAQEAMAQEAMAQEAMAQEAMAQEAMAQEAMAKEAMAKRGPATMTRGTINSTAEPVVVQGRVEATVGARRSGSQWGAPQLSTRDS
jgi:pentapeptide MXKDX repeat protein